MGHQSHPEFVTLHALRIKGFAPVPTLAEMSAAPETHVHEHLTGFEQAGHVQFREARGLWQLTPDGRQVHAERLADEVERARAAARLTEFYRPFLEHNDEFKQLCTDWQLRDGVPNDHTDTEYDRDVIERLHSLHTTAAPIVGGLAEVLVRLGPYAPRLEQVLRRVASGDTTMFTGVMCGSYHDVWMELHEDLILTQGIDRSAEGSF
ncbi:MAG: MarR family transcriptional regulator [Ilumatobacter sp.]|nr:MAG: MarR family transcriptional regulator [Ilumatobacter sp.]